MTPSAKLDRFLQKTQRLYSLPAVAMEVLELTSQPKIDIRALRACIETDPALAVKVLRVVNSSLFGLSRDVSDLNQALALLGIKPLKLLVLGFSLSGPMFAKTTGAVADRYWRHTLTKAVATRELVERIWRLPADEPFLAALIQDIGMLVLLQELGENYARLAERALKNRTCLLKLEQDALDFDHRELTLRLLEHWQMPPSLAALINRAGNPQQFGLLPPTERYTAIAIYLAGLMADVMVDSRTTQLTTLLDIGSRVADLRPEFIMSFCCELQTKVDQLAESLSLTLPPGVDYRDVLARAHEQMSQVAEELVHATLAAGPSNDEATQMLDVWEEVHGLTAAARAFVQEPDRELENSAERSSIESSAELASNKPAPVAIGATPTLPSASAARLTTSAPATIDMDDALKAKLSGAVAACRQLRGPLSLLFVEIDRMEQTPVPFHAHEAQQLSARLNALCRTADQPRAACLLTSMTRCAVILPGCDRTQAVAAGNLLVRDAPRFLHFSTANPEDPVTVSVGVATVSLPARNFLPQVLTDAAERCLDAAKLSGGNKLKSIGVY